MRLSHSYAIRGRSAVSRSFSIESLVNQSSALVSLPSWLTIVCATTGRTTQDSASTIKTGFGANAGRCRNVGQGWGLSVEKAATDFARQSNAFENAAYNKEAGAVVNANVANGPDGAGIADELDVTGSIVGAGIFQVGSGANVDPIALSLWAKQSNGVCSFKLSDAVGGVMNVTMVLGTSWARFSGTCVLGGAGNSIWVQKLSGTAKGLLAYAQCEGGKYPTSAFPAVAANAVRAADVLTCPSPKLMAPGGFFNLDFTIAPNYSQAEFSADHNLIYFDANNRVYLKQSDQTMRLRLGGVDITSGALTFAREDAIRIIARHSTSGRRLQVFKNGVSQYDSTVQSAGAAISLPASIGILGDTSTTSESADLRSLNVLHL